MKVLVLVSGGVDSTTCLGVAVNKYGKANVIALSIYYGQKHKKEVEHARAVTQYYGVELILFDLSSLFKFSNCTLLEHSTSSIPEESYEKQLTKANGLPVSTYVPFRNGLFISSAASIALSRGCNLIYYGAHRNDASGSIYPDCSTEFQRAMNKAIYIGSGNQVKVEAPFVNISKSDVIKIGLELNVPYELTWSCYEGGKLPCQKCATCIERKSAFEDNGVIDPALLEK